MSVTIPIAPSCTGTIVRANVYESSSECGDFALVYSVAITDASTSIVYLDGNITKWYKVGFVDDTGAECSVADAVQGAADSACRGRISARVGQLVCLDATFYQNGVPVDPYAIRIVRIYRRSVEDANLAAEIPFPDPDSSSYPLPALTDDDRPGYYQLQFDVPSDFTVPDIYFDVWYFIGDQPSGTGSESDIDDESFWTSQCNKFWIYPSGWFIDDGLIVPRLGFEPLDVKFRSGETRYLEVGMMPLPLYDFDYNLIMPMLPFISATINIKTRNNEIIINDEPMEIGLRQGTYRSNPFVIKWLLETSRFLVGTYDYQVTVTMSGGQILVSPKFTLTIS